MSPFVSHLLSQADPLGRTFSYYGAGTLRQAVATLAAGGETVTNTTTYAYDYRNLRTRKTVNGVTTVFHYDQAGRLLAETGATGAVQKTYVWLEDRPLAQLATQATRKGTTTTLVYFHTDPLDTPRLATSSAGKTVWRWDGEAFGGNAPNEDADGNRALTTVNLRFPGQYYDQETGMHYNWHRYYDPKVGRYVTSDPIGLEGGLNTYGYVSNNPLRLTDPFGLAEIGGEASIGVGGAVPMIGPVGAGGGVGVTMRTCCGSDGNVYRETILEAKGGVSLGESKRISPEATMSLLRSELPKCVSGISVAAALSLTVQSNFFVVTAKKSDRKNGGVSGTLGGAIGHGASATVNLVDVVVPLGTKEPVVGGSCGCQRW